MERVLFEHQNALADADLEKYARELGLDMQRWQSDLKSPKTTALIERDKADADAAGLTGTPFIVINGREFDGSFFRIDKELDGWIELELALSAPK
jgi:predicted DsbA family dithiol-disulfide isomerase